MYKILPYLFNHNARGIPMAIVARSHIENLSHKVRMLSWQATPLSFTRSGYGRRIPTAHMVKLPGSNRWRRVYQHCFGNAATSYVEIRDGSGKVNWHVISF